MLSFIQGLHLVVCLMILYILLKYYYTISNILNNHCLQKCLKTKSSDSS